MLDGTRAIGVAAADGRRFAADLVVLTAGAHFSTAILMRSGIGPEPVGSLLEGIDGDGSAY